MRCLRSECVEHRCNVCHSKTAIVQHSFTKLPKYVIIYMRYLLCFLCKYVRVTVHNLIAVPSSFLLFPVPFISSFSCPLCFLSLTAHCKVAYLQQFRSGNFWVCKWILKNSLYKAARTWTDSHRSNEYLRKSELITVTLAVEINICVLSIVARMTVCKYFSTQLSTCII